MSIQRLLEFENTDFLERHRAYGPMLNATDIDLIEYDEQDNPIMMIEAKHGHIKRINLNNPQFRRLRKTARLLDIPLFIVVYYYPGLNKYNNKVDEFGKLRKYYVIPANQLAENFVPDEKHMTELEYVKLTYLVRKLPFPKYLTKQLDDKLDMKPYPPDVIYPT
jgi:hypothetical protein